MHQIPDVLGGFDLSKRGHAAQPNSILNNPEQFAIGVLLYRRRCEIGSARIHPATGVSWRVPIEAMTCRAIGTVDFVSLFDARLQIGQCGGNTVVAASSNQDAFYSVYLTTYQCIWPKTLLPLDAQCGLTRPSRSSRDSAACPRRNLTSPRDDRQKAVAVSRPELEK